MYILAHIGKKSLCACTGGVKFAKVLLIAQTG